MRWHFLGLLVHSTLISGACILELDNRSDWPEEAPIATDMAGDLLVPGGEPGARTFTVQLEEAIELGCPRTAFEQWGAGPVWAACGGGGWWKVWNSTGQEWSEHGLGSSGCVRGPGERAVATGASCGPGEEGTEIDIEFDLDEEQEGEGRLIRVCHHLATSATLWARHRLWDEISLGDTGADRPKFHADTFYDYNVDQAYKSQKDSIAELVGSQDLAEQYVPGGMLYLSRGHLAPNADFIFNSWKEATFHYINAAPQWQAFNALNWAYLEGNCRELAVERGLDLLVYTGTHGVLELPDINGRPVKILLHGEDGLYDHLPVPRYYWKVLLDPDTDSGVALVGLNNPHATSVDPATLPCPALPSHRLLQLPEGHNTTDITSGYVWACRVEDLAMSVPEVPALPPLTLLE